MALDDVQRQETLTLLGTVFRPGAPVTNEDLFSGRSTQVLFVQDAVGCVGQHGVIFGERGVGKTSLALYCIDFLRQSGILAVKVTCDTTDTYRLLWKKAFQQLMIAARIFAENGRSDVTGNVQQALDDLDADAATPYQVRLALRNIIARQRAVIFFDEFDKLEDAEAMVMFSHTIKQLSDDVENVTVFCVGVAEDVNTLVDGHESIERCLIQTKMPRMTIEEIDGIVDKGLTQLGMTIEPQARQIVRRIPKGLPMYAHRLAQEGARKALMEGRTNITVGDIGFGMGVSISKVDHSLADAFYEATYTPKSSNYADVLFACSLSKADGAGFFSPAVVAKPFAEITGKPALASYYNANMVTLSQYRGQILERRGTDRAWRYRFRNPLMEPYVLIKGITSGRIDMHRIAAEDPPGQPTTRT